MFFTGRLRRVIPFTSFRTVFGWKDLLNFVESRQLMKLIKGVFFISGLIVSNIAFSQTTTAKLNYPGGGSWGTGSSWVSGATPTCANTVVNIPAGKGLLIDNSSAGAPWNLSACGSGITINISGTMDYNNGGAFLKLPCGSVINILSGGKMINTAGSGNGNVIYICGTPVYSSDPCSAPCSSGTINGPAQITVTGLPITLTSFAGKQINSKIELSWSTSSELKFDYINIENSLDGKDFSTLIKVAGHGTSFIRQDYNASDYNPAVGLNYYRLTSVDFDNYQKVFKVIAVKFEGDKKLHLSPNPLNGSDLNLTTNFDFSGQSAILTIYDSMGTLIASFLISSRNSALHLESPLKSGVYIAKFNSATFSAVARLVVL